MSSVTHENFSRLADCGHEYEATGITGRPRRNCDECAGALCEAHDCDKPQFTRRLCPNHYRRLRLYGSPAGRPLAESTKCDRCGESFEKSAVHQKFCSDDCRLTARAEAIRDARESAFKECPQCGAAFIPAATLKQKFCSKKCGAKFHRESSTRTCHELECDRQMVARGMCKMHWRRWARAEGMEKSPSWDDRRKANHQKRRALKLELPADPIRAVDVYERDEWTCGICTEPVDRLCAWPDPKSPSLDHVLPLSKGGHHVMENVQLAHLDCNVRKGNRE